MIQVGKEGETLSEPDTVWDTPGLHMLWTGPLEAHSLHHSGTVKPTSITGNQVLLHLK